MDLILPHLTRIQTTCQSLSRGSTETRDNKTFQSDPSRGRFSFVASTQPQTVTQPAIGSNNTFPAQNYKDFALEDQAKPGVYSVGETNTLTITIVKKHWKLFLNLRFRLLWSWRWFHNLLLETAVFQKRRLLLSKFVLINRLSESETLNRNSHSPGEFLFTFASWRIKKTRPPTFASRLEETLRESASFYLLSHSRLTQPINIKKKLTAEVKSTISGDSSSCLACSTAWWKQECFEDLKFRGIIGSVHWFSLFSLEICLGRY